MMKKSNRIKLGTNRKTCYIGLRGKNPFEIIKRNLAWSKRSFGNNEEEDAGRNLRCGKESYCK
jgi:hypothetical protein